MISVDFRGLLKGLSAYGLSARNDVVRHVDDFPWIRLDMSAQIHALCAEKQELIKSLEEKNCYIGIKAPKGADQWTVIQIERFFEDGTVVCDSTLIHENENSVMEWTVSDEDDIIVQPETVRTGLSTEPNSPRSRSNSTHHSKGDSLPHSPSSSSKVNPVTVDADEATAIIIKDNPKVVEVGNKKNRARIIEVVTDNEARPLSGHETSLTFRQSQP